ncbi:LytR/AlgR family response regulator transcription factor [Paenibacillus tarimensis]
MNNIRAMIAEDERLAREELAYLLEQESDIELLPFAATGRELLQLADELNPDVIFLDVQMPEMQGVQAARMLASRKNCPLIVFTTAYEDYAVDAFGLGAVDYVLKPYDHFRLKETIERLRQRLHPSVTNAAHVRLPEVVSSDNSPSVSKLSKLVVDNGERLVVLDPMTIYYAVREERGIKICSSNQCVSSKMTLQQLEEKLSSHSFYRTHRSYLVNLNYVLELVPWFNGAYNLFLKDDKRTQIPVARTSVKGLLNMLQGG